MKYNVDTCCERDEPQKYYACEGNRMKKTTQCLISST